MPSVKCHAMFVHVACQDEASMGAIIGRGEMFEMNFSATDSLTFFLDALCACALCWTSSMDPPAKVATELVTLLLRHPI